MKRRYLIAGNWKMNKTPEESASFLDEFRRRLRAIGDVDILLIPPFTSLDRLGGLLDGADIALGAQDLHPAPSGAYTGAISVSMLVACKCAYVLTGHSERRHVFGDSDEIVEKKLMAALTGGLRPILCVGETLEERRAGEAEALLGRQLSAALANMDANAMGAVTIAYEPVWAIGTGETATPDQAQEACAFIRAWIASRFDDAIAARLRILYGGSVKPENAASLLGEPDIDGALVGGASLDPEAFARITDAAAPREEAE